MDVSGNNGSGGRVASIKRRAAVFGQSFVGRISRSIERWFYIIAAVVAVVLWTLPPTLWLEVRTVYVPDRPQGQFDMDVDRVIHRAFEGEYTTALRTFPDRTVICTGDGALRYDPGAKLPDPVELAWWTNGGCSDRSVNPNERYIISTTWEIDAIPFFTKRVTVESNPFLVLPPELGETRSLSVVQQQAIELLCDSNEQLDCSKLGY